MGDASLPPILSGYGNWWGDGTKWGEMSAYVPHAGDTVGFLVSAGNGRFTGGVTSVRERSNVVTVALPADDTGSFTFAPPAPPPVVIPPVVTPPPVVIPPPASPVVTPPPVVPPAPSSTSSDTDALLNLVAELETRITELDQQLAADTAKILAGQPLPSTPVPLQPPAITVNSTSGSTWLKVLTSIAAGVGAVFAGIGASK